MKTYLAAVAATCAESGSAPVSLILFGSTASGGFSEQTSDVDLILILPDGTPADLRRRIAHAVANLEILHGFRAPARRRGALETFVERVTASDRSFFVCTRADLLSGSVAHILNLNPAQAFLVDRIVIQGILTSAVTFQGEELLPHIKLLPIRRLDVFKAFFGLFCQVLVSVEAYPALPEATRYAMSALKHSLHSCYFCYCAKAAPLNEEAEFFQRLLGPVRAIAQLLSLRGEYHTSFLFVARCLPVLIRLHLRTALDNRFAGAPRPARCEPS